MNITRPPPVDPNAATNSCINDCGKPAIIPIIINNEIPFPTPLSVIFSPNHITNIVPVTKIIIDDIQNAPGANKNADSGNVAFKLAI